MSRSMVKITPDAEVTVVEVPTFDDVVKEVGGFVDFAAVMFEPRYHLIFDQDGMTYGKEVNALASLLLGRPWDSRAVLVGDVLVGAVEPDSTNNADGDGWVHDPDIAVHVLQLVAQKVKAAMLR